MSITTKHGDTGQTSLIGGLRVSKGDLQVEVYGSIDELISVLGFARSICEDAEVRDLTKAIQRELFAVSSTVATVPDKRKGASPVTDEMAEALTTQVHRIEAIEGILADWSLPGEHAAAAAFDVARTVCRRAERLVVRYAESGGESFPQVITYLNRLSDLLWLFGRLLELRAGIDARLRDEAHTGPKWSRAW
jgi:cob(I)alamin adenosyltransferase